MYEVVVYETSAGVKPVEKYIRSLLKAHKEDNIITIKAMLDDFRQLGFEINKKYKGSIKHIRDKIYELRPKPSRIFFFYFMDNKFVLLHAFEKKCNKTPDDEIAKAEREMKDFIKRNEK